MTMHAVFTRSICGMIELIVIRAADMATTVQSNRHIRDLFFKCDDLRCWFSRVLFERDIYATFMRLFVLCLCINPFSKLDILLSRHIKVKYIFILASASKTLFIIAQ